MLEAGDVTVRRTSVTPALVGLTALKMSDHPALTVHGVLSRQLPLRWMMSARCGQKPRLGEVRDPAGLTREEVAGREQVRLLALGSETRSPALTAFPPLSS